MNYRDIPPVTPELWISNLIAVAKDIANRKQQAARWLDPNRYAWERPEELLCELFDDCNFELFLDQYSETLSDEQRIASSGLRDTLNDFNAANPGALYPERVISDPLWELATQKAIAFVKAFEGKWPPNQ